MTPTPTLCPRIWRDQQNLFAAAHYPPVITISQCCRKPSVAINDTVAGVLPAEMGLSSTDKTNCRLHSVYSRLTLRILVAIWLLSGSPTPAGKVRQYGVSQGAGRSQLGGDDEPTE